MKFNLSCCISSIGILVLAHLFGKDTSMTAERSFTSLCQATTCYLSKHSKV